MTAQLPALGGWNAVGRWYVPAWETDICWVVAGLPDSADGASEIWNSRWEAVTAP